MPSGVEPAEIAAALAPYEHLRVKPGVAPRGPRLCLDDVSAIPFLSGVPGVELYQHRARVRAQDGDLFAAVTPTVDGYEAYCRDKLGFGRTTFVHAEGGDAPLAVSRACSSGAAFDTLVKVAKDAGALTIFPYMGNEDTWALAAKLHDAAGVDVRVIAPPPVATWVANDKAALSAVVRETLGDAFLVETVAGTEVERLAAALVDIASRHDRVGLKRTRCASAMGNRVYESSVVRAMTGAQQIDLVRGFLAETECVDGEEILAVAWWATDCSPSTQLTIPAEGAPVVDGVYEQILAGDTRVFVGSRPSGLGAAIDGALAKASVAVAERFQAMGYVGRCSFDFLVDAPDGDFSIAFTECNGRWGGTSTPMHMVDRLVGRPRPEYRAQDVVHPKLVGADFNAIVEAIGEDLFDAETKRGRFVLYNVGPLAGSGKLDVIALGDSAAHADELMLERLPKLLGI